MSGFLRTVFGKGPELCPTRRTTDEHHFASSLPPETCSHGQRDRCGGVEQLRALWQLMYLHKFKSMFASSQDELKE
jgi:hypothetical protein